ncbi:MAG TPA: Crp/Fnr family transcriptional regulator [Solirubrobacteraceae bacterium]|nr:Crp/Fnr family transcriptional regulator [Solirubrobacteraceae bacterium]
MVPAESSGFLGALTGAERAALAGLGASREFDRGATVFHQREDSDRVVVVRAGRVKISTVTGEGREVVLAFRGPGDLLGEQSAIDGEPRSATVTALEPVEALVVAASDFRGFLQAHPRAALVLLEMLSRRLRDADRKRVGFAGSDTVGRVAARLVELSAAHGEPGADGLEITLPLSQEELAGWTGASREAVGKALHQMRALGWIRTQRRRIVVLDLEALRSRAVL